MAKNKQLRTTLVFVASAAVGAMLLAGVMASLTVMMRSEPTTAERASVPVLYDDLPAFELTNQAGQPFGRDELRGKVWVANFIFTRCPSICPLVTGRTAELQQVLRTHEQWSDIRLISFSVDPVHDTPEVLRDYGQRFGADPQQWQFLTGKRDAIWQLIEAGFRLPVEEAADADDAQMPILHSDMFVLVDRAGRIRGYYSSLDQAARAQLQTDLRKVAAEPWPGTGATAEATP